MKKEKNGRLDTVNTTTQGVYRILEIVFEFILFQMIKTNSKMYKNLIPSGLCLLEVLSSLNLIKFNICFLKDAKVVESRVFKPSLFHSLIADGKKKFLKRLC